MYLCNAKRRTSWQRFLKGNVTAPLGAGFVVYYLATYFALMPVKRPAPKGVFFFIEMAKHVFTGVFIPANIWLSKELSPAEKMILGEVEALSKETGWCYAGRKHFAEWLHCTTPNVTYYIARMEEMGYLRVERKAGERSRMQIINERFYLVGSKEGLPVEGSKPDLPGSKHSLRVGSKPDLPGSKEGLPASYIKEKSNKEIQNKDKAENPLSPPFTKTDLVIGIHDKETPGCVIVDILTLEAEKEKNTPPIAPAPPAKPRASKTQVEIETAQSIIQYLNEKAGRKFRVDTNENAKGIIGQLRQGYTVEQMRKVVDFKTAQWGKDVKMAEHLNPVTLFRPANFERYLVAAELPPIPQGPTHNNQTGNNRSHITNAGGDLSKYLEPQKF